MPVQNRMFLPAQPLPVPEIRHAWTRALNWDTWKRDGTIDPQAFQIVAETSRFDHCVFTVRQDLDATAERRWLDALFAMRYDVPEHREMMDLEGLKAWLPGRTSGFEALTAAVNDERYFEREANPP
jgi:ABC-type phosphate/phosphonate transport system substrate-binding protein